MGVGNNKGLFLHRFQSSLTGNYKRKDREIKNKKRVIAGFISEGRAVIMMVIKEKKIIVFYESIKHATSAALESRQPRNDTLRG